MPAFAFALQRVLDYRRLEEGWAKDALRLAREAREEVEAEVEAVRRRRRLATAHAAPTVAARIDLEAYLTSLDAEEESAGNRLAILERDEDRAQGEWRACRVSAEALEKLRERALGEWRAEEARREQADLDEWAVLRR